MIKRFNLRVIGLSVQWIKIYFNNICKSTKWISHKYNRNFLEYLDQWNLKLLSQFTQTILWEIASEPEFQYYPEIETNKRQNATIFVSKHIFTKHFYRENLRHLLFFEMRQFIEKKSAKIWERLKMANFRATVKS